MKKILLLFITTSILLLANTNVNKKHILVLHSYHKSMSWVENIDNAINETLNPKDNNYILHIEYMDTKRIFSEQYLDQLKQIYKNKYKNIKFDLILSSDNNAFDFLRKYRDEIFGNIPTSFSGVNFFKDEDLKGLSNYTGATEEFDAKETILGAMELFPNAKEIFVINDYLVTGRAWDKTIKDQLKDINKKITYSSNGTIEELQTKLKSLSKDTIVLLGVYFKDKSNNFFTYETIGEIIASSTTAPIFCLLEFNLRKGVIGGSLIGGYYQGEAMSKIAKKILSGTPISKLPVQRKGTTKKIFDYNALIEHNIDLENISKDTIILNKPISYYESHNRIIQISSVIILLLLLIISILIINIRKRKLAEDLLLKSKNKIILINKELDNKVKLRTQELNNQLKSFETFFEDSSDGILIIKDNKFIKCNQKAIKILKYKSKDELLNIHPSKISPIIQADGRSSDEKADEMIKLAKEYNGKQFEWIHTRSDGEDFWAEVTLTPMILNGEEVIHVIWRDISDKKKQTEILSQQAKLVSMGEMIGNIAHQWRQPLSVISTGATGIKIEKEMGVLDDETLYKTCDTINNNAQYLSKTIDDFKNFIKGDNEKKVFKLSNEIKSFLHLVEGTIKNNNISMIVDLNDEIEILGYKNELLQCLINIFNNAKDILNEEEIDDKFIFIKTMLIDNNAVIKIKDNAGGIPKDILPKIFEPYFTTKHQSQGTGLGLHMTYNLIVDGMKGTIEAKNVTFTHENIEYSGAEFIIKISID